MSGMASVKLDLKLFKREISSSQQGKTNWAYAWDIQALPIRLTLVFIMQPYIESRLTPQDAMPIM